LFVFVVVVAAAVVVVSIKYFLVFLTDI
jgi:hypothetical protein